MVDINRFKKLPLMGIVRGLKLEDVQPLVEVSMEAGLGTIEVTMNTPEASKLIARMREISAGKVMVGAGTVLSEGDLKAALDAGAGFIVMPVFDEMIVKSCVEKSVPVFPGAHPGGCGHGSYSRRGCEGLVVQPSHRDLGRDRRV